MTRKKFFENVTPLELCVIKANWNIYSKYRKYKQETEKYESEQHHARTHDQQDQEEHVATPTSDAMVALDGGDGFVAFDDPAFWKKGIAMLIMIVYLTKQLLW
eukprot:11809947-Ditylum_brightwellii.AAC.1